MSSPFGVCGADPGTTARFVFLNPRRRAPDWTNQGVKLNGKLGQIVTTFNLDQLFRARSDKLARYKQPDSVRFVVEISHNETGKQLKRALREDAIND